jgi:hypothetical protein
LRANFGENWTVVWINLQTVGHYFITKNKKVNMFLVKKRTFRRWNTEVYLIDALLPKTAKYANSPCQYKEVVRAKKARRATLHMTIWTLFVKIKTTHCLHISLYGVFKFL